MKDFLTTKITKDTKDSEIYTLNLLCLKVFAAYANFAPSFILPLAGRENFFVFFAFFVVKLVFILGCGFAALGSSWLTLSLLLWLQSSHSSYCRFFQISATNRCTESRSL